MLSIKYFFPFITIIIIIISHPVFMVTDHLQTCLKMRARDRRTAKENLRFHILSSRKRIRKTLGGWQPPPLLVRPRVKF